MSLTEAQVQSALKELIDPNTGKDFVTSRSAKNIRIDGVDVSVDIELGYPAKSQMPAHAPGAGRDQPVCARSGRRQRERPACSQKITCPTRCSAACSCCPA
jgi:hypothetical protein